MQYPLSTHHFQSNLANSDMFPSSTQSINSCTKPWQRKAQIAIALAVRAKALEGFASIILCIQYKLICHLGGSILKLY
jgi:hypothetical protein